jgi:hypothetical protein
MADISRMVYEHVMRENGASNSGMQDLGEESGRL